MGLQCTKMKQEDLDFFIFDFNFLSTLVSRIDTEGSSIWLQLSADRRAEMCSESPTNQREGGPSSDQSEAG